MVSRDRTWEGGEEGVCLRSVCLMASWGRSLWHRPSSVQHQLGTLPSDTPGPVTSSPGPQAFTARTTDRPSALLPDSLPPDALPAGGAGWGRAWASAGRPPPGARGRAGGRVGPPIPEPHASPGLFSPESLSELREYSEGLGEPTGADDCVPPAAGQSVISLLSSKELQQLIEEVRVLDEATLKVGVFDGRGGTKAWLRTVRSPAWAGAQEPRLLGAEGRRHGGCRPGVGSCMVGSRALDHEAVVGRRLVAAEALSTTGLSSEFYR